jgi:hypothetical protein
MIIKGELLPSQRLESALDEVDQLCRIVGQSLNTAKGNRGSDRRSDRSDKNSMRNG